MNRTIALIPARSGSKGVPSKNWRPLAGRSCVERAIAIAEIACEEIVLHTDHVPLGYDVTLLLAGPPLHTDGCPMIDIVRDALDRVPGAADDIWVLLQPSSPLRTVNHVTTAIDLLKFTKADSVVTIVETVSIDALLTLNFEGMLKPAAVTPNRQRHRRSFKRDGTAYVFWRKTVADFDNIYGPRCTPLIMDPAHSLSIDTPEDWAEAERRLLGLPPLFHENIGE